MAVKRRYEDGCAAAHALELIGERWALLVVRELVLGPRRFTDLRHGLPGVSPNVLTHRLQELEEAAIVTRRKLPPPAGAWVYELTDWGQELEPIIRGLGRWAVQSPRRPVGLPIGVNALVLSFRTMFDPDRAGDAPLSLALALDGQDFAVALKDGGFSVERGAPPDPQATLAGDPNAVAAVVYGGQPLGRALRDGRLRLEGDRAAVERFISLFPHPADARVTCVG